MLMSRSADVLMCEVEEQLNRPRRWSADVLMCEKELLNMITTLDKNHLINKISTKKTIFR